MFLFAYTAASFILAFAILKVLIPLLIKNKFHDVPNERSMHKKTVPRGGGLGIITAVLVCGAAAKLMGYTAVPLSLLAGAAIIALTSLADDKYNLRVSVRLLLHTAAVALVLYNTGGLKTFPLPAPLNAELGMWGYFAAYIWFMAVMNIYNFLDGIDGFSGTQALLAGLFIALLFGNETAAVFGLGIAGASLAFLYFNWHPAKVFMGDVGSVTLGFLFAGFPFFEQGFEAEAGIFHTAMFLFFFLSDGVFTIVRRALKGEKIWLPHRRHLFQRLATIYPRHNWVTAGIMAAAVLFSTFHLCNVLYFGYSLWLSVSVALVLFGVYLAVVTYLEKKHRIAQ